MGDPEPSPSTSPAKKLNIEERRRALQAEKLRKQREMEALEAEEAALLEVATAEMGTPLGKPSSN